MARKFDERQSASRPPSRQPSPRTLECVSNTCSHISLQRTPLFLEVRERIVSEAKREDLVVLVAWLLTNFTDDGSIRSPNASKRATIVLDGVTYWLVRRPSQQSDKP
jgi:hypothetical protein